MKILLCTIILYNNNHAWPLNVTSMGPWTGPFPSVAQGYTITWLPITGFPILGRVSK